MKALVLLIGLLVAQPCAAAVAHVKSDNGQCTSTSNGTLNMSSSGSCTGSQVTIQFTYTASATGDAVLFFNSCGDQSGTPSAVTLTATGWTLTQVGSITGSASAAGWSAVFKAYAPNTTAATFTATWTATTCTGFFNDLIDEFSGMDGTNFVDVSNSATATSTTSCNNVSVTPTVNNDGLWAACSDNQTAAAAGWTKGGDDGVSDISVWKILSGGSGVSQSPGFGSSTGTSYVVFMVGIKPAGGAAPTCAPTLSRLGVSQCGDQ